MTRIWILLGLVVVLGAGALVAWWGELFGDEDPDRRDAITRIEARLPAIEVSRIVAIEIKDDANHVRLQRRGEDWILPERYDAPVMTQRLDQILEAVAGLETAVVVGRNPDKHATFQVTDDQGKTLRLEDAQGGSLVHLVVGKQDNSRGYEAAGTFVRPVGEDLVYLHPRRLVHLLLTDPAMWMKKSLTGIAPGEANELVKQATRIVVEYDDVPLGHEARKAEAEGEGEGEGEGGEAPPAGTDAPPARVRLVLACKEVEKEVKPPDDLGPKRPDQPEPPAETTERKWHLEAPEDHAGMEVYAPFADNMVRMLLIGQFNDVAGKDPTSGDFGFDAPVMDVRMDFADGTSRQLKVGKPVPEDPGRKTPATLRLRYAFLEGSPYVVALSEYSMMQWKKKPEDLKLPSTAPTSQPTGPKPIALPDDG